MQFSGKSVIITGAGKGIGRACAQLMAARGAEVVALIRTQADLDELREEIGVTIGAVQPWKVECVDYPHALVRLNFCKVHEWTGELHMHEGQEFAWQQLPVQVAPVLPGTIPVLQWFAQERGFDGPNRS